MMKRFAFALLLTLCCSLAHAADAILHTDTPGQTLYVRVRTALTTSVAAALTEGTGNGVGYYVVTDATLAGAGLSGTAVYPYKVFSGTPSASANDPLLGVGSLNWVSTAAAPPPAMVGGILGTAFTETTAGRLANNFRLFFANADAATTAVVQDVKTAAQATAQAIAATKIAGSRTWRPSPFDSSAADNIVTVKRLFAGDLEAVMPLNPDADVGTFDSVTIAGPAAVTATNLRLSADGLSVIFAVPSLTTAGSYTVLVTVTTLDGQEIPMECRLIVR